MSARVIPFDGGNAQLEPTSLIAAFNRLRDQAGDLRPLVKLAARAKWSGSEEEIKEFASLSSQFVIHFPEPAEQPNADPMPVSSEVREAAQKIGNAIQNSRTDRFWRAQRMNGLLGDTFGVHDPVKVIERHLHLFFDPAKRPSPLVTKIRSDSGEYHVLRALADSLATTLPKNANAQAILYFLSDPYTEQDKFSIRDVRRLAKLKAPFSDLVFTRFTFPCEDRLDPMPRTWDEFAWVYGMAKNPFQMNRLIAAAFELRDHLEYKPEGGITATVNDFFVRVTKEQEKHGGVSVWDDSAATNFVFWFYNWSFDDAVKIDFPSRLCGVGQDYYEPQWPQFDEWASRFVREARDLGYVELAQALVGYKLLDEVLFAEHVTHWPTLSSLLLELRSQPFFEITARAVRLAVDTLMSRGQPALAARLEAFAAPPMATPDKVIRFVVEGSKRPKVAEEIEARLVEHLGDKNWAKLTPQSKTWLIEADFNWSRWRFEGKDEFARKDWSAPALQFCKALENEFVRSFGSLCAKAGDRDPAGKVTLGNVMTFLKEASRGDEGRAALLRDAARPLPSQNTVKALQKLVSSYRNIAAHPHEFDLRRLDDLRRLLFSDRVLRDLLEHLPAIPA